MIQTSTDLLDPKFRVVALSWGECVAAYMLPVRFNGYKMRMMETLRTKERQVALAADGKSKVTLGWHCYGRALDFGLFEKYGIRMEHIYIRGSGPSLAALAADEIQFLYCAADATMPGLATGIDAKLVAAPLVKIPYVLVTRKEIRRLEDLKGKALGVTRPGDLSARLSRAVLKKFNLTDEVMVRPIGGSQNERFQAMAANVVQGIVVPPPLDVRAKSMSR